MFQTEHLQEKWSPVLAHPDLPKIEDAYKRAVTTLILENQEKALKEDAAFLGEAHANQTGTAIANWDPILISLVRRAMPNLVAYDICGVQPMTGPTGLIFAMKARYQDYPSGNRLAQSEALGINEPRTAFSAAADTDNAGVDSDPEGNPFASSSAYENATSTGMSTATAEALGDAASNSFAQM